jgi:hypothetical protein
MRDFGECPATVPLRTMFEQPPVKAEKSSRVFEVVDGNNGFLKRREQRRRKKLPAPTRVIFFRFFVQTQTTPALLGGRRGRLCRRPQRLQRLQTYAARQQLFRRNIAYGWEAPGQTSGDQDFTGPLLHASRFSHVILSAPPRRPILVIK